MAKSTLPAGYASAMSVYETQRSISFIKRTFQDSLAAALNLKRVSAPLFVTPHSGLNDNLSGVERPVGFDIPDAATDAQVVQSLAKWKRMALHRYGFCAGEGLYTDMNAIRRDEVLDNLHSIYVDQWDWEKIMLPEERTLDYLKATVRAIVGCICDTLDALKARFPQVKLNLQREVCFIDAQTLLERYPGLDAKGREHAITKECGTVFIIGIGGKLSDGQPHDNRAPDYDDWSLNGDILFYNELLDVPFELSSMGIRVDPAALDAQLSLLGCDDRRALPFHKMMLEGKLPLTIGGGIGQSRLCMLLMQKAHIGEVQCSIWDEETLSLYAAAGIHIL